MLRAFPLILASLFAAACLPAQSETQAHKACLRCARTGTLPCTGKDHEQKRVCGVTFPHKCDPIYRASCCNGLEKVLCSYCKDPVAEAELDSERALRLSWLESMDKVNKETTVHFVHVETDHFLLHFSIPGWKVKENSMTRVKAAHWFAQRMEEVAAKFEKIFGVLPGMKQEFQLVNDVNEQKRVTLTRMGGGHTGTYKMWGAQCRICQWPNPAGNLSGDEEFLAHTIHNATHTMTQPSIMVQMKLQAWFDEGLSAWMEIEQFKVARNFCYQEVNAKSSWQVGDWSKKIFGEISAGKEEQFANIIAKELDRMSHRDIAHSWSFVDFMIKAHPAETREFFRVWKSTNDTKKALDQTFNMSTSAFHDAWRAWAIKTYGGR